MNYGEQLAQRKQEAADEEAAFIAHFGPEAEDCANWDDLWQNGWREVLVNPSPTETYKPKGLPPGWVGGWVSEDGREAGADPPSLYSDKFVFYFAQQLADDKAELLARTTNFLAHADEIDCDQWTTVIDIITTYLSSSILFYVTGRGHRLEFNQMDATQREAFFQQRNSKQNSAGLFITSFGVSITNHQVVPAEVARGKIQAVRRQIEIRQQQLQVEFTTQSNVASSAPTRQKATREPRAAKLAPGIEVEEVHKMLTNLGMGSTYDQPGEWAAAFRALWVAGLLTGSAPAVVRWAVEHVRLDSKMLETFKKLWQNEWNEADQFKDAQRVVFRKVSASAQRVLSTKGHR